MRRARKSAIRNGRDIWYPPRCPFFRLQESHLSIEHRLLEMFQKHKNGCNPLFYQESQPFIRFLKAGEEGLEPPSTVLETAALPLNYSPMVCCISEPQLEYHMF